MLPSVAWIKAVKPPREYRIDYVSFNDTEIQLAAAAAAADEQQLLFWGHLQHRKAL